MQGLKVAVSGKGGVGKSTLAAALCRILSKKGYKVLAIDADPDANLASALGLSQEQKSSIRPIASETGLIEQRTGAKQGRTGQMFSLSPDVSDVAQKYGLLCNGVSLLVLGAVKSGGGGCACPENAFLKKLIRHLVLQEGETVVIDMEPGIEHLGRATASGVEAMIIVLEPGTRSKETARRIVASAEEVAGTLNWDLPPEDPGELGRKWAAELDGHGISRAALMASIPGDADSVQAAVEACPKRFLAFAMVNPREDPPPAARLDAMCLFPAMHRYSMHDARVQPLLDQAAAQGCALFVHCGALTVGVRRKLGLPSPFDMRFANPLELHPIAIRYPGVRFIVPHFGAGYLREALMLADLCPNVFLDTSSSNSWMRYEGLDLKVVFRRVLDAVGAGRLLFGTDSSYFPRGWNYDIFEAQTCALLDLGISSSDARLILGENLERIFPEN